MVQRKCVVVKRAARLGVAAVSVGIAVFGWVDPAAAQEVKPATAKQRATLKTLQDQPDRPLLQDFRRFSVSPKAAPAVREGAVVLRSAPPVRLTPQQVEEKSQYEFPDFRSGEERRSSGGRLETSLAVVYGERKAWRPQTRNLRTNEVRSEAGVIDLKLRSYEGLAVGPTLRVKAGDVLRVRLSNQLPIQKPANHVLNEPSEFNRTNLHTHGLHVTPVGNGDNVLLEVRPGETHLVEVAIPRDHIPGTFWYHSHVHGSTAIQVSSGMAGALIIEPPDGDGSALEGIPEIKNAQERICVFQQIAYLPLAGAPGQTKTVYGLEDFDGAFANTQLRDAEELPVPPVPPPVPPVPVPSRWENGWKRDGWRTTINGQLQPVIRIPSGKLQRLRFIHGGVREVINVQLAPVAEGTGAAGQPPVYDLDRLNEEGMREIAVDGIPLDRMRRVSTVQLYPGYRSDVLVRLTNETSQPKQYVLWNGTTGNDFNLDPKVPQGPDWTKEPQVLAILEVAPSNGPADAWPSEGAFAGVRRLPKISEQEVEGLQMARLAVQGGGTGSIFRVNGKPYDPTAEPLKLKLGRADEWRLTSITGNNGPQAHPFHIHVNPFYLVSETDNETGTVTPIGLWRDTLLVNGAKTYRARTRYENYLGDFVIHCHLLDHEDEGMMKGIRIVNAQYEVGTKIAKPYLAPMWKLPDAAGTEQALAALLGEKTVVVFLEAQDCTACNAQMQAYQAEQANLPKVVFVAPGEPKAGFPGAGFPFPVVFDKSEKRDQYRAYGVYEPAHQAPLHGTFVLDATGRVRWREVAQTPYTDLETLKNDLELITPTP